MKNFFFAARPKSTCVLLGLILVLICTSTSFAYDKPLKIRDLYARGAPSPLAVQSLGKEISLLGFMAPPLLPDLDFFILTKMPLAVCPFCEPEMEWPDNLVFIRMKKMISPTNYRVPIVVTGRLEIGDEIDEETGFYSKVRLVDAQYKLQ